MAVEFASTGQDKQDDPRGNSGHGKASKSSRWKAKAHGSNGANWMRSAEQDAQRSDELIRSDVDNEPYFAVAQAAGEQPLIKQMRDALAKARAAYAMADEMIKAREIRPPADEEGDPMSELDRWATERLSEIIQNFRMVPSWFRADKRKAASRRPFQ